MICTILGMNSTPSRLTKGKLKRLITVLLENGASCFYVENGDGFERLAQEALKELSMKEPRIKYRVISSSGSEHNAADSQRGRERLDSLLDKSSYIINTSLP